MHSSLAGGPFGSLLAWIGLFSLIYWGWRLYVAYQAGHKAKDGVVAPATSVATPSAVPSGSGAVAALDNDIAVIAAAVWTMLGGAHRIVHLEAHPAPTWAIEGRWMNQTSHTPR